MIIKNGKTQYDTWDIVERKNDQHIVGSCIVLTNKYNTNGTVNRKQESKKESKNSS